MVARKKRTEEDDIVYFLKQLNEDIKEFIGRSIELSPETKRVWSKLDREFNPVRCHEIRNCEKKDCIAYDSKDYRCWLQVGTLCGGAPQGEFTAKYRTCFNCDVFRKISREPIRALYENIDILIYHLQNKAIKFHDLAIKDHLTGLYNRHFFNEFIERELASAERRAEKISFIMIDLDNFKEINDRLGHLTGDRLLVEASDVIQRTIRRSDLAFRFGGDEFLVLMVDAACDETTNMVNRLFKAVEKWNRAHAKEFGCRLSFSIGCATCGKSQDIHMAIKEADQNMYRNKKEKKNTTSCSE